MSFRVIVRWGENYVNIPATKIEKEGDVVYVYDEGGFSAMFDLGAIDMIYKITKADSS